MKEPAYSIIEENETDPNQSAFTDFLNQYQVKHGRKFNWTVINIEMKRNKLPKPDATGGSAKYWEK